MLTENDVVRAVAVHLSSLGWNIQQQRTTDQTGIDLIAVNAATQQRLLVEAKGGTSSKEHTERFGKPFTGNQARSHVAVALYCGALMLTAYPDDLIALAFPDDENHWLCVEAIGQALLTLGIRVFFVSLDGSVAMLGLPLSIV